MTDVRQALAAIKMGYEADGKTMFADGMVEYVETIADAHDELITALAKAAVLDRLASIPSRDWPVVLDVDFVESMMTVDVGKEVGKIMKLELDRRSSTAPAPMG